MMAKQWMLDDKFGKASAIVLSLITSKPSQTCALQDFVLLYVPPDGRCFFWVLLVDSLSEDEKTAWRSAERRDGWPLDASRKHKEDHG